MTSYAMYQQTLFALVPRRWEATVFTLVFAFFTLSLATNTGFEIHIGIFSMGVFVFSVLVGSMVLEILNKPLSFCLPNQQRSLIPVIVLSGACFCLGFIFLSLELMQMNEDHADYPLVELRAATVPLFFWSLAYYLVLVSLILRSLMGAVVVFVLLSLVFDQDFVASLQLQNYPVVAFVFVVFGCLFNMQVVSSREQARKRFGGSLTQTSGVTGTGLTTWFFGRTSRMLIIASNPHLVVTMGKLFVCLFFSAVLLFNLLSSFRSMDSVQGFYLLIFPLIPLCFPLFSQKVSFSPFLPLSRTQHFYRLLVQGVSHYLFAVFLMISVRWLLTVLVPIYPHADWLPYADEALNVPFRMIFLLTVLAPLVIFFHLAVSPLIGALILSYCSGIIAFNVLENGFDGLLQLDWVTILLVNLVSWVPFLVVCYLNSYKRDLLITKP